MLNSFLVASGTVVISLVVGVLGGYALARLRFPFRRTTLFAFLITYMLPPIALLIPLYLLVARFGLLDTKTGLIIVYCSLATPFSLWTMSNFLGALPAELEEAARVDGLSRLGALFRVILPLARPGIVACGLFAFLLCWDEFLYSLIFTSTTHAKTIPVAIAEFTGRNAVDFGLIAAGGILASLPPLRADRGVPAVLHRRPLGRGGEGVSVAGRGGAWTEERLRAQRARRGKAAPEAPRVATEVTGERARLPRGGAGPAGAARRRRAGRPRRASRCGTGAVRRAADRVRHGCEYARGGRLRRGAAGGRPVRGRDQRDGGTGRDGGPYLAVSHSGRSAETVEAAGRLPAGRRVGLVGAEPAADCPLGTVVDRLLPTGCPTDSRVSTASYTATLQALGAARRWH